MQKVLVKNWKEQGIHIFTYFDDGTGAEKTLQSARAASKRVREDTATSAFVAHPDKCCWEPTQVGELLGFILNLRDFIRVPPWCIEELKARIDLVVTVFTWFSFVSCQTVQQCFLFPTPATTTTTTTTPFAKKCELDWLVDSVLSPGRFFYFFLVYCKIFVMVVIKMLLHCCVVDKWHSVCEKENTSLKSDWADDNQTQYKPLQWCFWRTFTRSFLSIAVKCSHKSPMVKSLRPSAVLMYWNRAAVGPEPLNPNCSVFCFLIPNCVASDFQLPIVLDSLSSFDDSMSINFGWPNTRSHTLISSR